MHDVIDPVPPAHWHRERGGALKAWLSMLEEDRARMSGPGDYGLGRWNREWLERGIAWPQDRDA